VTRPRPHAFLVACALLAATAAPDVTQADPLTTSVVSGNVAGPSSTFTEVTATADCGGQLVSGGGTRLAQSTDTVSHNGIHVDGSLPSGADGPTSWVAAGGSGGGVPNDAQTLAYAVCLASGPAATRVVVASTAGPSQTFQVVHATATCPDGTRLLSGGARTTPGTVGSLKPSGSYPSDAAGTPLVAGTNPSSWTVTGLNGGGGDQGNTTFAFALCATAGPLPTVTIAHARVPGPALASTPLQTTVACPDGTALLGGGGFISDAFGLPGSQGDHLTGSYPSDSRGTPVASGPAAAWTAASHTGGVDSGSLTQTDVWAMCATPADAPPPAAGPTVPVVAAGPRLTGGAVAGRMLSAAHGAWSNRPTAYAYRWLRCRSTGRACLAVAGARGARYRLAFADIGARIRVQITARNAAGAGTPATSPATASVRASGPVSTGQVATRLRRDIVPASANVAGLLRQGVAALPVTALEAGRVSVSWYQGATLVAAGGRTFSGVSASTVLVRLTSAGRQALGGAPPIRLTARGVFTPRGRPAVGAVRAFVVAR
jgi:hypothetical protein